MIEHVLADILRDVAGLARRVGRLETPEVTTAALLPAVLPSANLLTNPGLEIWQRGSGGFTATNAYTADRWQILLGGTSTVTVTREGTTIDGASLYAAKAVYVQGSANSQIDQLIEDFTQLRGKTLTLSVRVRQGVASNVRPYISDSGAKTYGTASATTGSYVTLMVSLAIGAAATSVRVGIDLGASDTVYLDNAILTIGSLTPTYRPLHPADDLARCQRYFEVQGGVTNSDIDYQGYTSAAQELRFARSCVPKAVVPTITRVGTWSLTNVAGQPTVDVPGTNSYRLRFTSSGAGLAEVNTVDTTTYISIEANP